MGGLKVREIVVDRFRRFNDIAFGFGDKVTLIAGQNGTSKSTLLGMLAQPLQFGVLNGKSAKKPDNSVYTTNYHNLKLHEFVDLTGNEFFYDCEDVFRLSLIHDHPDQKEYEYKVMLEGGIISENSPIYDSGLTVYSKHKPKKDAPGEKAMRFVAGPGKSHKEGEGNFPHPVIYLGLNRLWPLALNKKCEIIETERADKIVGAELADKFNKWYVEKYNEILCLEEHDNKAELLATSHKDNFIVPSSSNYNGESCSAGQDNLGQILTAILSFRRLKEQLGGKYQGGLLLIDELDATFHAHAQKVLLKILVAASEELDLQIIATTHSLLLLEQAYRTRLKSKVKVIYLLKQDEAIIEADFSDYDEVMHHLNVTSPVPQVKRNPKASVIFEDEVARFFFKAIIGTGLSKYINYVDMVSTGAGELAKLAKLRAKVPELSKTIVMPDGDMRDELKGIGGKLVFLPGKHRPETLLYEMLFRLPDSDPFWRSISSTYNRSVAITSKGGISVEIGNNKEWVKKWFKDQSPYWGKGNNLIFKLWIKHNKEKCHTFCTDFCTILNTICNGIIPSDKINRIIDKYA